MKLNSKNKKKKEKDILRPPSLVLQLVNRYIRWILSLLVIGTLLLGYVFVINSKIQEVLDVAQQNLPVKEKVLSDLKDAKKQLDDTIIEFNSIKNSKRDILDRIDKLLPSATDYNDLFATVDEVTKRSGLTLNSINITFPDAKKTAPPGTDQQIAEAPKPTNVIKSLSIHIAVEGGTYESFKSYLATLERHIRLFDVKSITLDGASFIPTAEGTVPTPHYDVEFTTYYQSSL